MSRLFRDHSNFQKLDQVRFWTNMRPKLENDQDLLCLSLKHRKTRVDEYIILRPHSHSGEKGTWTSQTLMICPFHFGVDFSASMLIFQGIFSVKQLRSSHLNPRISNHQQRRLPVWITLNHQPVWNKTSRHLGQLKIGKNQKARLTYYFTCQQNHPNILPVIHEPPQK